MTSDYGHASLDERARIDALHEKLEARAASPDELLELALLSLEPMHVASRANDLLRDLVAADSKNHLALVWLAYVLVYEFMDAPSLREAITLCEKQVASPEVPTRIRAAAWLLKATALRDLRDGADALPAVLESVALAPDWVSNRSLLANIYGDSGDVQAALGQLREALGISRVRPETSGYADELFELLVTRRGGHNVSRFLEEDIRKLELQPHP